MTSKRNDQSIIRHINLAQKERTILFSDIVQSTKFWAKHGDVKGRLMLDRHNWLLFPIVKQFKGRIIKTIGDSIFASFKKPENALKAAVAMQQILERERQDNKEFSLKIRIGLHTGKTIVEHNDVYGDTVNIASRIENHGKANQILMSSDIYNRLEEKNIPITEKGRFKPKGKSEVYDIYQCRWEEAPDLIAGLKIPKRLPLIPRQRIEMVFYLICGLAVIPLLCILYLRFFLGEVEALALIMLKPVYLFTDYPLWLVLIVLLIAGAVYGLTRLKLHTITLRMMHVIKGSYGYFLFFLIAYVVFGLVPKQAVPHLHASQFESKHLFVKTVVDKSAVYERPDLTSAPVMEIKKGRFLLLADVKKVDKITWNKVLVRRGEYGWLPRVLPPAIGVPEKRISLTKKFYFRNMDIYALLIGLLGFFWGWLTFRVRPA